MSIDNLFNSFMISIENPALTYMSKFIARITEPQLLLIISIIISVVLFTKYSKRKGLFFTLIILTATILIRAFKEVFSRPRPINQLITETGFSFPSGHATMAIVFFGCLVYLFSKEKKKTLTISIILILLIGLSRIYLRVHYLSDVLAGFILGSLILATGIYLDKKLNRHKSPK